MQILFSLGWFNQWKTYPTCSYSHKIWWYASDIKILSVFFFVFPGMSLDVSRNGMVQRHNICKMCCAFFFFLITWWIKTKVLNYCTHSGSFSAKKLIMMRQGLVKIAYYQIIIWYYSLFNLTQALFINLTLKWLCH